MPCRTLGLVVVGMVACAGEAPPWPAIVSVGSTGIGDETSVGDGSTMSPAGECGNGDVESGEECDGIEWQGATCESLGFGGGSLACSEGCMFDTRGCFYRCGDGRADPGEKCDGSDLKGQTCEDVGLSGEGLACVGCELDGSGCGPPPGMVEVPGGVFEMGLDGGPTNAQPIRQVHVDRYWIDQTEVTVQAYEECEMAGECTKPSTGGSCNWMVSGRKGHPVNCVDWDQAVSYCAWSGGGTKRLPTEAEWEKAARGTDGRMYPWGNEPKPSCSHVVMDDPNALSVVIGDGCGNDSTMAVGSKSRHGDSPYGARDMAGNVWEWVSDWFGAGYAELETENPVGPANGDFRVVRGGSLNNDDPTDFRAANRSLRLPNTHYSSVGFRCVRTPPAAR